MNIFTIENRWTHYHENMVFWCFHSTQASILKIIQIWFWEAILFSSTAAWSIFWHLLAKGMKSRSGWQHRPLFYIFVLFCSFFFIESTNDNRNARKFEQQRDKAKALQTFDLNVSFSVNVSFLLKVLLSEECSTRQIKPRVDIFFRSIRLYSES